MDFDLNPGPGETAEKEDQILLDYFCSDPIFKGQAEKGEKYNQRLSSYCHWDLDWPDCQVSTILSILVCYNSDLTLSEKATSSVLSMRDC